jgi:hypothetical protein
MYYKGGTGEMQASFPTGEYLSAHAEGGRERFLIIIGDMQEGRDQSGRARLSTSAMACGVPIGPPRSIGRENGIGIARHVETRCENSWKRNG